MIRKFFLFYHKKEKIGIEQDKKDKREGKMFCKWGLWQEK